MSHLDITTISNKIRNISNSYENDKYIIDNYLNTYGDKDIDPTKMSAIFTIKRMLSNIDDLLDILNSLENYVEVDLHRIDSLIISNMELTDKVDYIEKRMKIFGFMYDEDEKNKL